mgnify:FL=1
MSYLLCLKNSQLSERFKGCISQIGKTCCKASAVPINFCIDEVIFLLVNISIFPNDKKLGEKLFK